MAERDTPIVIELNPRERRLYDRLRSHLVERRPGQSSSLRDVMLLLPDLTVLLMRLLRDRRVPLGSKALALVGIGYLFSPLDLIPDALLGPIGLVDDILVVGLVLSRLMNHVHPDVVRTHWPGQGDALEAVRRATGWAEGQVSRRVRALTGGWLHGAGESSRRSS